MGIRFLCPNGHKLHVKAFLAGKRAICPECDAEVIVPDGDDDTSDASVGVQASARHGDSPWPTCLEANRPTDAPSLSQRHAEASTPTAPIAEPPAPSEAAAPESILPDAPPTASIVHRTKIKRRQKRQVQVALLLTTIVVVLLLTLVLVVLR